MLTIQELALLYAYVKVCIEALIDKGVFNANKSNPQGLFLGSVLSKIRNCLTNK